MDMFKLVVLVLSFDWLTEAKETYPNVKFYVILTWRGKNRKQDRAFNRLKDLAEKVLYFRKRWMKKTTYPKLVTILAHFGLVAAVKK